MVLGLKAKNRKSPPVQASFLFRVLEIKPWPPSQSLRSLRAVLLQWENGERVSGSTSPVVPSLGSSAGDGKIVFNEPFRISVTFVRDYSIKSGDFDAFQKNCLSFNLYETRRDKAIKGQLLGTGIIDMAEYGLMKDGVSVSVPMNCKRSFSNMSQPILFINIHPVKKGQSNFSPRGPLQKEASLDEVRGFVGALINEKYPEEAELSSFTDDDVSSHSSITVASSSGGSPKCRENGSKAVKDGTEGVSKHELDSKTGFEKSDAIPVLERGHGETNVISTFASSVDLSSDEVHPLNDHACLSSCADPSLAVPPQDKVSHCIQSPSSSRTLEGVVEVSKSMMKHDRHENLSQEVHIKGPHGRNAISSNDEGNGRSISVPKKSFPNMNSQVVVVASSNNNIDCSSFEEEDVNEEVQKYERLSLDEKMNSLENDSSHILSSDVAGKQISLGSDSVNFSNGDLGMRSNILNTDKSKHVKSVRSPLDSCRSSGLLRGNMIIDEVKEDGALPGSQNGAKSLVSYERSDANIHLNEKKNSSSYGNIQQLEHRIKLLEGELREAASVEVALYAAVADHGSSMSKVHAPARRLSRLYLYTCKELSQMRRASAARSAVSGLVLAAKACGNDVPRLTFWLSNSVMLRVIITQSIKNDPLPPSAQAHAERNGSGKGNKKSSALKWKESFPATEDNKMSTCKYFGGWEDPCTFVSALEKTEAWIFSRVIESIWWQTLTPYMQPAAAKAIDGGVCLGSRKNYGRMSSLADRELGDLSQELWKKAFRDACERLCPIRAGGHECGCLPLLARLIMEQCVARLDVAMFNATLRENSNDIPTDPVSDPISDPRVLPVPVGKSSFGAGVQLKNAIGNWSRCLTDLFGMDEDELAEEVVDGRRDSSFKPFRLLNALSDLMMLPKDMLLNKSIRKEVCPAFGAQLIKRILINFVPDEFCPDPIPKAVLDDLDTEYAEEMGGEVVTNFPCSAAPIAYSPPSPASLGGILGDPLQRSGSLVLRKSYTSDDELDELDAPLASVLADGVPTAPASMTGQVASKGTKAGHHGVRYQLLREVWLNGE